VPPQLITIAPPLMLLPPARLENTLSPQFWAFHVHWFILQVPLAEVLMLKKSVVRTILKGMTTSISAHLSLPQMTLTFRWGVKIPHVPHLFVISVHFPWWTFRPPPPTPQET
jgi:hypothetical protein